MTYDNRNRGALFVQSPEEKRTDKSPDYNGTINPVCLKCKHENEFWIAGWRNTSKGGKRYISLSLTEKEEQPRQASQEQTRTIDDEDDVPW